MTQTHGQPSETLTTDPRDYGLGVIARCATTGAVGAAIASSAIASAARCLHVEGETGAVLVMAYTNQNLGPLSLKLIRDTLTPEEVVSVFRRNDRKIEWRQFAILSQSGDLNAFSGDLTQPESGLITDGQSAVLGNSLRDAAPLDAAIKAVARDGALEDRLMWALQAGAAALHSEAESRSAGLVVGTPDHPHRSNLRIDFVADPGKSNAIQQLAIAHRSFAPMVRYYEQLAADPAIGSWRNWYETYAENPEMRELPK